MPFLAVFVQIKDLVINLDDCSRFAYRIYDSIGDGEVVFHMINHYRYYGETFVASKINIEAYHTFLQAIADGVKLIILN